MQRTVLALVALLALAGGCGQSSPAKIAVTSIDGEAGVDASDGSSAEVTMARCCVLQVADAGATADAGDAAPPRATDSCSILGRQGLGVVTEPCLSGNSDGPYGLWTCGTALPQLQCGDNGFSCGVGDPCTLVDVGCPGIVQACTFKPYTPPPG